MPSYQCNEFLTELGDGVYASYGFSFALSSFQLPCSLFKASQLAGSILGCSQRIPFIAMFAKKEKAKRHATPLESPDPTPQTVENGIL